MDKKPTKGAYLETILRSAKTVFTIGDIALLWGEAGGHLMFARLNKYVRAGKLIRLRRGIYAKDENFDRFELANRIYTPSYISFETVLTRAGINFQYYQSIFEASYLTREIIVGDQRISFVRLKDTVLTNLMGIERVGEYSIATRERAFLDRIYVSKDYHFDNLRSLDWDRVFQILPIYHSKRLGKKVQEYYQSNKANQ